MLMISTDKLSIDLFVYNVALEGECEVTVWLDIDAMNMDICLKDNLMDLVGKVRHSNTDRSVGTS